MALAVAVAAHLYEGRHARPQPAQVALLQLCVLPQLLEVKHTHTDDLNNWSEALQAEAGWGSEWPPLLTPNPPWMEGFLFWVPYLWIRGGHIIRIIWGDPITRILHLWSYFSNSEKKSIDFYIEDNISQKQNNNDLNDLKYLTSTIEA